MSANIKSLNRAIFRWITAYVPCGVAVFQEMPNAARPKPPCVTYTIKTISQMGRDNLKFQSGTSFEISGQRKMVVYIMTYGEDFDQMAFDLQSSLETVGGQDMLRRAGLAIWGSPQLTDVSLKLETGIEYRMSMDVVFGFGTSLVEDVGIIETVEAEGTFETPSGDSIIVESTINV